MKDETLAVVASNLALAYYNANPNELKDTANPPRPQGMLDMNTLYKMVKCQQAIFNILKQQEEIQRSQG